MNFWYKKATFVSYLLLPFSFLFWLISQIRRFLFQTKLLKSYRSPVAVVVVGNLSVGGNGKTPVVIWLVQQLQQRGLKCAVISRGYGSQAKQYPLLVNGDTNPIEGGDEPVLIAKRTGVPVCISPNRQQAIEMLLQQFACDVIISDDGLQHYKLQRDVEIVVMDAQRGFGNGFVLPAGPLRELPARLQQVDLVISNGGENPAADVIMQLQPHFAINLLSGEKLPLSQFSQGIAIAGIGNPQRFFNMLQQLNIQLQVSQAFQDHQAFSPALFQQFDASLPLFMTEKDAVKCASFAQPNWWYVPVEAEILGQKSTALLQKIIDKTKEYQHDKV